MIKIILLFIVLFGGISVGRYVYSSITPGQKKSLWSILGFSAISAGIVVAIMTSIVVFF